MSFLDRPKIRSKHLYKIELTFVGVDYCDTMNIVTFVITIDLLHTSLYLTVELIQVESIIF